jgi:hypothetical protein
MIPRGGRPCGAKTKTSAESGQETGPRAETKRKSGHLGALWRRVKKKLKHERLASENRCGE